MATGACGRCHGRAITQRTDCFAANWPSGQRPQPPQPGPPGVVPGQAASSGIKPLHIMNRGWELVHLDHAGAAHFRALDNDRARMGDFGHGSPCPLTRRCTAWSCMLATSESELDCAARMTQQEISRRAGFRKVACGSKPLLGICYS